MKPICIFNNLHLSPETTAQLESMGYVKDSGERGTSPESNAFEATPAFDSIIARLIDAWAVLQKDNPKA